MLGSCRGAVGLLRSLGPLSLYPLAARRSSARLTEPHDVLQGLFVSTSGCSPPLGQGPAQPSRLLALRPGSREESRWPLSWQSLASPSSPKECWVLPQFAECAG